jgi:Repeat of unknown function (DUF5907)
MKKIYLLLLFVFGFTAFGQQKGISYQAVIINPNEIVAPGFNGTSIPLANKAICLSFQIVNSTNQVEYQESQSITTDGYGMVNVVIGTGTSGAGLVSTLEAVAWNQGNKKLVVGVNTDGVCSNYTEISNQVLNYTPYSFYALNADLKDGYVTDVKVAMGINPAKVGLGNVNNTSDANKPVSTATQTALNLKANTTDVTNGLALKEDISNKSSNIGLDAGSTTKYPSVKAIKDYVDAQTAAAGVADGSITSTKIANGTIVNADVSQTAAIDFSKLNIQKSDIVGLGLTKSDIGLTNVDNTSDANKPVSTATQTALNLKEDKSNKSVTTTLGTSNVLYPTQNAVKTYVDTAIAGATIVDADATTKGKVKLAGDLAGTADLPTVPGLALKANATDVTTSLTNEATTRANSDATLQTNINTLSATVTSNATTAAAATALKENAANKSTDVSLADATNVKFPTELAVKTYVNSKVVDYLPLTGGTLTGDLITSGVLKAGAITYPNVLGTSGDVLTMTSSGTVEWASGSAIVNGKEDAVNKSTDGTLSTNSNTLYPSEQAVKTYVDGSITSFSSSITTLQNSINTNQTANNNALAGKEDLSNKSTSMTTDANSVSKYPSVKLIKDYVDGQITSSATSDATTTAKGKIKLAGDLGGTADLPTVPALASKANLASPTFTGTPVLPTGTTAVTQAAGNNTTALATTAFVMAANATNANLTGVITSVGNTTSVGSQTGTGSTFVMSNSPTLITPNLGTPSALVGTNITALPLSSGVTGVLPVANGGSGATSLTGYLVGNGTNPFTTLSAIPVSDVTGAVTKVNGVSPVNGNVTISFGSVTTGVLLGRPASGANGDIYVISGDSNSSINGNTYIFDGSAWQAVTSNISSTDARYVKLSGSTMSGNLAFPTGTKATMADAPSSSTDVTNKAYVDAQIASASPVASTTVKGIVKLAGDLGGSGTTADAPVIAANAITSTKIADGAVTSSKLDATGVTANTYGSTTAIPIITVDAKGRITSVTTTSIAATLTEITEEFLTPTASQTSFTVTQTPASSTKVKMFINGVLIKGSAHSEAGKVVTYIPANNGNYVLTANDEVVFYYYY